MSPQLFQYRIVYRVGRHTHEWIRSGVSKRRVEDLMRRTLLLMHHGRAELVSVEPMRRETACHPDGRGATLWTSAEVDDDK